MAGGPRLNVGIEGDANGLSNAMKKGENSLNSISKAFSQAKLSAEQFDAAAKRNSLEQYDAGLRRIPKALNETSTAQNKVSGSTRNMTASIGSANSVAIEFNRIIQDAPFGIMGVGNNITQLASQFSALKMQTGSTGAALKATFASIMTSGNLLSLGISAAVTGFTIWQMQSQKANKATKELEDGTKTYIETLKGLEQATAKGQDAANKELVGLRLLYEATQNLSLPMESRRKAAKEIIDQYPRQFAGLNQEEILLGKAASAYDKLAKSITATATAAAYANKITENASKQLNNQLQIMNKQKEVNKLNLDIQKQRAITENQRAAGSAGVGASSAGSGLQAVYEQKQADLLKEITDLGSKNSEITQENAQLQRFYNDQIALGADLSGKVTTNIEATNNKLEERQKSLKQELEDFLKANRDLTPYQKLEEKYNDIYAVIKEINDLDPFTKKFVDNLKTVEELDFILKSIQGTLSNFNNNAIGVNIGSPTVPQSLPGLDRTQDRIDSMVRSGMIRVGKRLGKEVEKELSDSIPKGIGRAVSSSARGILNTLTSINTQADQSFKGIVATMVTSLSEGINGVLQTTLVDGLQKYISEAFANNDKLSGAFGKWIAGAGIAGGLVSGISSKTSALGQGLGGAISGAAAGTAIMPGIGTAVGAFLGALGGIFGASSAKRQEKMQEIQIAETKKTNALIERQTALAYGANIIGQQTVNGIVTGVDRDAYGRLVAKIAGQDIALVLERFKGTR